VSGPGARFGGRVALVTGAGGGIGRATAALLASEGAAVVSADVDRAAAEATAEAVRTAAAVHAAGGTATAVALDVTDPAACAAAVAAAVDGFGRLDLLVNVAGVGAFAKTTELTLEQWNATLAVNLTGTFLMCQQALGPLIDRRGAIVNIASVAGVRAVPYNAAYCASKAGVILLTKSLAVEFAAAGLRVNCVCPSSVDTGFLRGFAVPPDADPSLFQRARSVIDRRMPPEEVAAAVAYLASDDAAMMTGTALVMDGGATA
jgi:meso-butanediol dehydrogenase/(S,S)-butanediol dehydrogenase/diacetyl reductase